MKKFSRAMGYVLSVALILTVAFLIVPFIDFDKTPYSNVIADAARVYGLNETDYIVEFKDDLRDRNGNQVYGLYLGYGYNGSNRVHKIQIRNVKVRPMMVATIFHEFAHAAQFHYSLDREGYTIEQHAEILSFTMMWENDYRWDALHLMPTHLLGKSQEYRAIPEIFSVAFGGTKAVSFSLVETESGFRLAE